MVRVLPLAVVVSLTACVQQDKPAGPVQVSNVGTIATGDAIVQLYQVWMRLGDEGTYNRTSNILVHTDGRTGTASASPALLADNCSDQPAALGSCIVSTKLMETTFTQWTFDLQDGTSIVVKANSAQGSVTRIASDGSTVWNRDNVLQPDNTIRAGTLLIIQEQHNTVDKLAADTGDVAWSYSVPSSL